MENSIDVNDLAPYVKAFLKENPDGIVVDGVEFDENGYLSLILSPAFSEFVGEEI